MTRENRFCVILVYVLFLKTVLLKTVTVNDVPGDQTGIWPTSVTGTRRKFNRDLVFRSICLVVGCFPVRCRLSGPIVPRPVFF